MDSTPLIFLLLSMCCLIPAISVQTISAEMQKLLAFKSKLSDTNLLHSWERNQNMCSFSGISCRKSLVVSIDLSYLPLSMDFKHVSSIFLSLEHLEKLKLRSTNLMGSISTVRSSCSERLIFLDLSDNRLEGLVSSFSSCHTLKSLNVSFNQISGKLSSLPSGVLMNISKLEVLDLSSNNVHGPIPAKLCQRRKTALKHLYLQNNQLTGSIPTTLGMCSKLISVDFSFNYLSGTIPLTLGSLKHLRDLILSVNGLEGEIPSEISKLQSLETLILDYNGLIGLIPYNISKCKRLVWISLLSNRLSGVIPSSIGQLKKLHILILANNSFSGAIPPEIGDCRSLFWLDLHLNLLSGTIPLTLTKRSIRSKIVRGKSVVFLRKKPILDCPGAGVFIAFSGIRRDALARIPNSISCTLEVWPIETQSYSLENSSIIYLDLSYNMLEGSIPKEFGQSRDTRVLYLGHNRFSGSIPTEFGNLQSVGILDISYNQLIGSIPYSLSGLTKLTAINFSSNKLTGPIPEVKPFSNIPASAYLNTALCGKPLPPCRDTGAGGEHVSDPKSTQRSFSLVVWACIGGGALCLVCCLCIYGGRKMHKRRENAAQVVGIGEGPQYLSSTGGSDLNGNTSSINHFAFSDLMEATDNFHKDNEIGAGGYGHVYKAVFQDGTVLAVKELHGSHEAVEHDFKVERETIGTITHPNIIPLLGFCDHGERRFLVYPFVKFGSLHDMLHGRKRHGITLNWDVRRKIAMGIVRGLEFLHNRCNPRIVHRDIKPANILIDENLEPKIADFGLAKFLDATDSHMLVLSAVAGTRGYMPPDCFSMECTCKVDVYSFGVLLLELITGRKAIDFSYGDDDAHIVQWVGHMSDLSKIIDRELIQETSRVKKEIKKFLKVARNCVDNKPEVRPSMSSIMTMIEGN